MALILIKNNHDRREEKAIIEACEELQLSIIEILKKKLAEVKNVYTISCVMLVLKSAYLPLKGC